MIRFEFLKNYYQKERGAFSFHIKAQIREGEFIVITGPSGGGKSTFLRLFSGMEEPDWGYCYRGKEIWLDKPKKKKLPIQDRKLGFLFQTPSLFPHLSVVKNLCYGGCSRDDAFLFLRRTGLEHLAHRLPSNLSGGEKQRVSLLRTIGNKPEILLFDEPFSALDRVEKDRYLDLIKWQQTFQKRTILLVTHEPEKVLPLADRSFFFEDGRLIEDLSRNKVKNTLSIPY